MPGRSCGISRYLLWRSDRECWWFRRAVPGNLVGLIGKREWRQTLKARSRADAEREAISLLDETNRTIDLALAGNWPPVSDDEIEAVASRVGLPPGARWFLYVGGLNPHKRVDAIIAAHARVVRESAGAPPWLVLAGPSDEDVFHADGGALRAAIDAHGTHAD